MRSLRDYNLESRSPGRRVSASRAELHRPLVALLFPSRPPPSMCLSNDNKLPNECVQSYSIIATTGGGGRPADQASRRGLESARGESKVRKRDCEYNGGIRAEHEAEHTRVSPRETREAGRTSARRSSCNRALARTIDSLFYFYSSCNTRPGVGSRDPFPADRNVKLLRARRGTRPNGNCRRSRWGGRAKEIIRQTCINPSRFKYFPAR